MKLRSLQLPPALFSVALLTSLLLLSVSSVAFSAEPQQDAQPQQVSAARATEALPAAKTSGRSADGPANTSCQSSCSQPCASPQGCTTCPPKLKTPRAGDEVYFVDTRNLACTCHGTVNLNQLRVEKRADCQWVRSDVKTLLTDQSENRQTIFWVHGNRVNSWEARRRGLDVYRALLVNAPQEKQVRFVIWSWPADQIRGPLKDVRYKAYLSGPAGYQLGSFLAEFDSREPVGLIGFSFGARVITGALHTVAGGSFDEGNRPAKKPAKHSRYRAVLMSAALHDYWLEPGQYHGQALNQVEQMLLLNNSCDRALVRYHYLDPCCRPAALGVCGPASLAALGEHAAKIQQFDACCDIGPIHDVYNYLCNKKLMAIAWNTLSRSAQVELAKSASRTTSDSQAVKSHAKEPAPTKSEPALASASPAAVQHTAANP